MPSFFLSFENCCWLLETPTAKRTLVDPSVITSSSNIESDYARVHLKAVSIRPALDDMKAKCIACFLVKDQIKSHLLQSCPSMYNRCYKCLDSSHKKKDCNFDRNVRNLCRICCLPNIAAGVKLHDGNFNEKKNCLSHCFFSFFFLIFFSKFFFFFFKH